MSTKTLQLTTLIFAHLLLWQHMEVVAAAELPSLENQLSLLEYCHYDSDAVVEKIWKSYVKCDATTYLKTVHAQLNLFWLTEEPSDNYLLKVAYSFYKIKMDPLYNRLNNRTKELLEAAIENLPTSLQYLFDKRDFCLLNSKYSEILFQSTTTISTTQRRVYTNAGTLNYASTDGNIIPHFEETIDDSIANVNVGLFGKQRFGYYNRMSEYDNQIGANITAGNIQNYIWTTQLVNGNQLVFRQGAYIMCADTNVANFANRYVYGFSNKSINATECQWSAGLCDRR